MSREAFVLPALVGVVVLWGALGLIGDVVALVVAAFVIWAVAAAISVAGILLVVVVATISEAIADRIRLGRVR